MATDKNIVFSIVVDDKGSITKLKSLTTGFKEYYRKS